MSFAPAHRGLDIRGMHGTRPPLVFSFLLTLVLAGKATGLLACYPTCSDPGLKAAECGMAFGKFDDATCSCIGARPYTPYTPPSSSTPDTPVRCESDSD